MLEDRQSYRMRPFAPIGQYPRKIVSRSIQEIRTKRTTIGFVELLLTSVVENQQPLPFCG